MNYVAIDPSYSATAVAYHHGGVWYGGCAPMTGSGDSIHSILNRTLDCGMKSAVIERSLNFGPNPKTQDLLAEVRGRIYQMCLDLNLRCVFVTPNEWQGAMLGKFPRAGKSSKERRTLTTQRKAMSVLVARSLGADDDLLGDVGREDHNIADAVCLCEYARLNEL